MKIPCSSFAALFLALNVSAYADMTIVQKVEGAGQLGEMTMKFKGDKVRADVSPQISTITDAKSGEVVTVMHSQKSYMKISAAGTKALMEKMQKMKQPDGSSSPTPAPKLQSTGKKDKINGFDVEEYTATIGGMTVHYWIAKNYPNWSAILGGMMKMQQGGLGSMAKGMGPSASDFPGMPIRTEMEMNGQKITTTVQSVKEGPLDAKDFEVPAGYKEMQMPSFGTPPASPDGE